MDTIGRIKDIINDQGVREKYDRYRLEMQQIRKKKITKFIICFGTALLAALLIQLHDQGEVLLFFLLVPFGLIALIVWAIWTSSQRYRKDKLWEESINGIVAQVVGAVFPGAEYTEQGIEENYLQQCVKHDRCRVRHVISGTYRNHRFTAEDVRLDQDGGEDPDVTVFSGLILQVNISKPQDYHMAAKLFKHKYKVVLPKKWKDHTRDMHSALWSETERVFSQEWMTSLYTDNSLFVEINQHGKHQQVEAGFHKHPCIELAEADADLETFVTKLSISLAKIQKKLDLIIDNKHLFI